MEKTTTVKEKTWLFQKGQSGNPKGRPKKGKAFADILEKELANIQQEIKEKGKERIVDGKTLVVLSLIKIAFNDADARIRLQALEKIMERLDGKPCRQLQVDAEVKQQRVFDEIDVSKLSTNEKKEMEHILKKMCSE